MVGTLAILLAVTLSTGYANQENQADSQRILTTDRELRGKFDLLFEPDENRGESRTALRHIGTFFNKRPGVIKPTEMESMCKDSGVSSGSGSSGGYTAKSLLPAIIASLKEDALHNVF